MRIAIAGATGCVGSRLIPRLLDAGHTVTALVRDASAPRSESLVSAPGVRVVEGDLLTPAGVDECCCDADIGVYLVHSLGSGSNYADRDCQAATAFARAASTASINRVVYLGGLGDVDGDGDDHLHSRRAVESVLGADRYDYQLTTVRAGVVIGSNSLSFQLMRQCAARVPVAPVPPAINTPCQPIAVRPAAALGLAAVTDVPYQTVSPLVESLSTPAVVSDPKPAIALGVDPIRFETAVDEVLRPTETSMMPNAKS